MDATTNAARADKAPAHLWLAGGAGLLWHAWGCYDFLMTNVRDAAYLAQVPADRIDYIDGFPAWAVIAWATSVGCGLIGSILLLGRLPHAAYAFAFSVLGLAGMQLYQYGEGTPASMGTAAYWSMRALAWFVALALLGYARRMRARSRDRAGEGHTAESS
ncbi:hypothetical protein HNO88_001550 [Novosphingobium chloroacetimidivorans]|uniref:Uncharacterized protein n=1 Tax=Novosphingobium chloroacetimidivorans TaxID=1428314 RepID=A0A7W7NVG7_9SPHN|nr:hypothetical protein [Novosphingobium chloroacetimidivorans]MBB4858231.1 hypothetical protein [Novosphingobium chloroacetimidivorans]